MNHKTRPATAAAADRSLSIDQQLERQTNTATASTSQASYPADDAGEDDWQYFRRRPGATTRTRFPLASEFPDDFLEHGGAVAFVRVAVVRDGRGQPVWAARSVMFRSGGSA
jgi:hypothetical protein